MVNFTTTAKATLGKPSIPTMLGRDLGNRAWNPVLAQGLQARAPRARATLLNLGLKLPQHVNLPVTSQAALVTEAMLVKEIKRLPFAQKQRTFWRALVAPLDGAFGQIESYLLPFFEFPQARVAFVILHLARRLCVYLRGLSEQHWRTGMEIAFQDFATAHFAGDTTLSHNTEKTAKYSIAMQNLRRNSIDYADLNIEWLNDVGSILVGLSFVVMNLQFISPMLLVLHVLIACATAWVNIAVIQPLNKKNAKAQNTQTYFDQAMVPILSCGTLRDHLVWKNYVQENRQERMHVVVQRLNVQVLLELAIQGMGVLLWLYMGLLGGDILTAIQMSALCTTMNATTHLEKIIRTITKRMQAIANIETSIDRNLETIQKTHQSALHNCIQLEKIIIHCNKQLFTPQQLLEALDKRQPGHYVITSARNGQGKTMFVRVLCMAYPGEGIFVPAYPNFVSGAMQPQELSTGERMIKRIEELKPAFQDASFVVFDEVTANLATDNCQYIAQLCADLAQQRPVIEVRQSSRLS